jgi:hypothetical protein
MKVVENKVNLWKFFNLDSSLILLIISNILTIIFALKGNWSLIVIMWAFWIQSVIIGIFNFIKILSLKKFSTENFKINNQPVKPTDSTKHFTALFFLFHYGFFHFIYMVFLLSNNAEINGVPVTYNLSLTGSEIIWIIITGIIFFSNHLFSYIKNYENDSKKVRNIGTLMFFPYARIIPMHLTICMGLFLSSSPNSILFFMILKTLADVVMHQIEHKL